MDRRDVRAVIGRGYKIQRYNWREHSNAPVALSLRKGEDVIRDRNYWYGKITHAGDGDEITLYYATNEHPSIVLVQLPRVLGLREILDRNGVPYNEIPPREDAEKAIRAHVLNFLDGQLERLTTQTEETVSS